MIDKTELKRLAEAALRNWPDSKLFERPECERFIDAARPDVVLALIAENAQLEMQLVACGVVASSNTREAAERQRDMHPDYMSASCQDVILAVDREMGLREERDQLRAEVAGLRTGYEAYERVNAELKAEVEELRKYGEEFAVLTERRREEADALRKDSESYRLLSFCHGQGTLELVRSHHELCAEIRRLKILAGEPVPPTPEEFIGPSPEGPTARIRRKLAALGQGERS